MAFSSSFITCPPLTARTTTGTSTRQDVDSIYLVLVLTQVVSKQQKHPPASVGINSLQQILKKALKQDSQPPLMGGTWSLSGVRAAAPADLHVSPGVRQAAGAGAAGMGSPWFL